VGLARVGARPDCSYHLAWWTDKNHRAGRGGMTRTSTTEQPDSQAVTNCPGGRDVWYLMPYNFPLPAATKPSQVPHIPTTWLG
jgi:hypothetical protein